MKEIEVYAVTINDDPDDFYSGRHTHIQFANEKEANRYQLDCYAGYQARVRRTRIQIFETFEEAVAVAGPAPH